MIAKEILMFQLLQEKSIWLENLQIAADLEDELSIKKYIEILNDKIERLAIELDACAVADD